MALDHEARLVDPSMDRLHHRWPVVGVESSMGGYAMRHESELEAANHIIQCLKDRIGDLKNELDAQQVELVAAQDVNRKLNDENVEIMATQIRLDTEIERLKRDRDRAIEAAGRRSVALQEAYDRLTQHGIDIHGN